MRNAAAGPLRIDRSRSSPNHGERRRFAAPDCVVLHYTGMRDGASAVDRLCDPVTQVSCHYVISEAGAILGLVDEDRRAWHAGRSVWQGETDLNSASIGIEIVNGGHDFGLPAFPADQIGALIDLCRDIVGRHCIPAARLLAHSDIAPGRKQDPGERFPWQRLADAGVGLWPAPTDAAPADGPSSAARVQADLHAIGYGVPATGVFDDETVVVIRAFQRRYRPDRIDGLADGETSARLAALRRLHATTP